MRKTPIQWTEQTWNPVRGCSPVSPGCKNCYAEKTAGRFCAPGKPFHSFVQIGKNGDPGPHWTGKVELIPHMLEIPLRTKKPTTWFVNSMSDLFHEGLKWSDIERVFDVMQEAHWHTFQVLTKRAENMRQFAENWAAHHDGPLPNVWLGVSVEDRERLERIERLRRAPAAVRFVSFEPLLEDLGLIDLKGIDLAIWGGESGPGARQCDVAWIRNGMRQAKRDGCRNFVKQLGASAWIDRDRWHNDPTIKAEDREEAPNVRLLLKDKKGGDMAEWPQELGVREMPRCFTPETPKPTAKRKKGDRPDSKEESEGDSFEDFQPDDAAQEAL